MLQVHLSFLENVLVAIEISLEESQFSKIFLSSKVQLKYPNRYVFLRDSKYALKLHKKDICNAKTMFRKLKENFVVVCPRLILLP